MSTADSLLNSASVIFVNNLMKKEMPEKKKLRWMMWVSFIFGIGGCIIALQGLQM